MRIVTTLDAIPTLTEPCGLTIGSFDGIHIGHQHLIRHLRAKLPPKATLALFTFSNHPSHTLTHRPQTKLICTPEHKCKLLKSLGVDLLFFLPFTEEFSQTPFDQFLIHLYTRLHFSHLVLGEGATFGKNREGNEENIKRLGLNFDLEYIAKLTVDNQIVSSGLIRTLIAKAEFETLHKLLNRPYSILLPENPAHLPDYVLPPDGTYTVTAGGKKINARIKGHTITLDDPCAASEIIF